MKTPLAVILLSTLLMQAGAFAAEGTMQMQMPEHMQHMQKMMDEIKAEQDPEKRAALMQQHMESMQQGMQMMGQGNAGTTPGTTPGMTMEGRMEGMEKMMEMMQMMMGQMMQHEEAETDAPVHQHDQ